MAHRGIHSLPNNGATNDWLTPPEIVKALGKFDLDPCAHPKQFYKTARRMIAPPQDGLSLPWKGRVWLNPPYGESLTPWIEKMATGGYCGSALVPARTEVEKWFWPFVWEKADAVLFLRGRLYFYRPDGTKAKGNAGHGTCIVAYGIGDVLKLEESGIDGKFIRL